MASENGQERRETLADIMAEIRRAVESMSDELPYAVSAITVRKVADRIETVARRAYDEIDSAVCGIECADSTDTDAVRAALDNTIGEYYE